jgi:hypothetical protein
MLNQTNGLVTIFSRTFLVRLKSHCTSIHNRCSHCLPLLSWEILSHRTTPPGNKRQDYLRISRHASTPLRLRTTLTPCHTPQHSLGHRRPCLPSMSYAIHPLNRAGYKSFAAAFDATSPFPDAHPTTDYYS